MENNEVVAVGTSIKTNEAVIGDLLICRGNVNYGHTYICPIVSAVSRQDHGDLLLGPFIEVYPGSVQQVPRSMLNAWSY